MYPRSDPPVFAFQKGIAFGGMPLGYELGWPPEHHERALGNLQSAMGSLVATTVPDEQSVRGMVDELYARNTAGAPADFDFRVRPGESITGLLAEAEPGDFRRFCEWHRQHFDHLVTTINDNRGALRQRVAENTGRLIEVALLPGVAARHLDWAARTEKLTAVDSFDGALVGASFSPGHGIAISHQFDAGYTIGAPTELFFRFGVHECLHAARPWRGSGLYDLLLLEEVLIEHCVVVANHPELDTRDVVAAAEHGAYRALRRLFGALGGRDGEFFGMSLSSATHLLSARDNELVRRLETDVPRRFAEVFSERGIVGWQAFLRGYEQTHAVRRQEYAEHWAQQALERTA